MAASWATENAWAGPKSSFTYLSAHPDSSLLFTRVGQPLPKTTSALARNAVAMLSAISSIRFLMKLLVSSSNVRMLPPRTALSGITFAAAPPWNVPIVSTAFSFMASSLALISSRAIRIWAAALSGSTPALGIEPWHPVP